MGGETSASEQKGASFCFFGTSKLVSAQFLLFTLFCFREKKGSFHGNLSLRRRHFGNKKSLVCKLLKEEVHLLYFFLGRCELRLSLRQDKFIPALYGKIQSTNDFPLRRRLARSANYYYFTSRFDSFEFGHLLKCLFAKKEFFIIDCQTKKIFSRSFLMYSKFCNDLVRSCCGEDVAEKKKGLAVKNPVLLTVKRGSDSTK